MGTRANRQPGFSLIEVLVSVVIMSFGLLSLAAVQGTLFKAGSESRAQSVALAMAQEKIEYFEGYKNREEFQSFTDGSDAAVVVDGVSYTRSWTVERYAYPEAGGNFELVADTGDTASGYVSNNEFKRIQVKVAWTDATGTTQEVALEAALAALSPQDTAKIAKASNSGGPRGPQVIIVNPASEEGVIPIAVGDGSDTAATNPRPEVASNKSQRVIETRFDVLTYAALTDDAALAQSRVETVVAGCTCSYDNAPSSATRGKRPTYWNGLRYVVPEDADFAPPAGEDPNADVQSSQCTVCCRDHHDPTGVKGALFDPRRGGHSEHQLYDSSTGELGALSNSGTYTESCRLIRVDGIFRVASDMYDDYMNLLETDNGASDAVSDYVPTATATSNYQDFVLNYLDKKFVKGSTNTYNTVLDPAGQTVADLEETYDINAPADPVLIVRPTATNGTTTEKWLHNRGLYVDYLEDEAIQAINDAKDDCKGTAGAEPTETQLRTCVLKVLPFTTINLTELTDWTPTAGDEIVVSNNDFRTALDSDTPVRGKVVPGSHPSPNLVTYAIAHMRESNSGIAVMKGPIDTGDATSLTDNQAFQPDGGWSGADNDAGSGGTFQILLGSYNFPNDFIPTFGVSPAATCNPATEGSTQPNPFTCTTQYIGDDQSITIAKYNYQVDGTSSATLTCTGQEGPKVYPGKTYTTKTCRNYEITAWSLNNVDLTGTATVTNPGSVDETTTISVPGVAQGATIDITFGSPEETMQTPVCTYRNKGNNINQFSIDTPDCD